MEISLELKQTQKLSPQMIQSMEILQMGTQELQAYVEKTLLENPVLEREEVHRVDEGAELLRRLEWLQANDRQNHWYHREDANDLADSWAAPERECLYDHLWAQIPWAKLSPGMRRAMECVLTGLGDNGYLEESTEELAQRCGEGVEVVAQAEALLHCLEPAGLGARSLAQCLMLQLERAGASGLAMRIARDHLEDMARSHFNHIARATGASREEIQAACAAIRALDPRPGAAFAPVEVPGYITPDLVVVAAEGEMRVRPCEDYMPQLQVSAYYQQLMRDTQDSQVREYLSSKIRQACWVVRSIEQRKSTLVGCAQIIVRQQEAFFRLGMGHLRPMTLADVAEELGVHDSTVSRAIKEKYLQCAWGVFPLGYFFSRALPSTSGDGVSPERAKAAIRALIEGEDKRRPLSDQKICDLLAQRELVVSRRTVAKYRDEMGIPSTPGRKVF